MARLFDDAASEYLEVSATPITDYPLTLNCWFYTDDVDSNQTMIFVGDSSMANRYLRLGMQGTEAGDPVIAFAHAAGGSSNLAYSTTGCTVNTWHMATGVFTSKTNITALIDGGSKGEDDGGTPGTGLSWDTVAIGRNSDSSPSQYMSGRIAQATLWNRALTDDEIINLYQDGVAGNPWHVRPNHIVAHWPLFEDDGDINWGGDATYDLTAFNTPTYAEHVPFQKLIPLTYPKPAAAGPGPSLPKNHALIGVGI